MQNLSTSSVTHTLERILRDAAAAWFVLVVILAPSVTLGVAPQGLGRILGDTWGDYFLSAGLVQITLVGLWMFFADLRAADDLKQALRKHDHQLLEARTGPQDAVGKNPTHPQSDQQP
jgi:ABC-type nickel/cobalt efflux system permease component RcnA